MDAGVAVSVGDEDVAGCGVDGGVGGAVEHFAALAWDFFAGADGEEVFASGGVFVDLVTNVVDEPEVVFVIAGDAVGTFEPAVPELEAIAVWVFGDSDGALGVIVAPHIYDVAVGFEDQDGHVAAVEDVDVVFGVGGNGGSFSKPDSVGDFGPSGYGFVVGDMVGWQRQGRVSRCEAVGSMVD